MGPRKKNFSPQDDFGQSFTTAAEANESSRRVHTSEPAETRDAIYPGLGITFASMWHSELNLNPLLEQYVSLTTESSLQPSFSTSESCGRELQIVGHFVSGDCFVCEAASLFWKSCGAPGARRCF